MSVRVKGLLRVRLINKTQEPPTLCLAWGNAWQRRMFFCASTLTSLLLLLLPSPLSAKFITTRSRGESMRSIKCGLAHTSQDYASTNSTKYSQGGYSSTTPWLRWHLYCDPPAAGVLWGIGFLAIWDQKEGIGATFIGAFPSTYSPVEPRALVEICVYSGLIQSS